MAKRQRTGVDGKIGFPGVIDLSMSLPCSLCHFSIKWHREYFFGVENLTGKNAQGARVPLVGTLLCKVDKFVCFSYLFFGKPFERMESLCQNSNSFFNCLHLFHNSTHMFYPAFVFLEVSGLLSRIVWSTNWVQYLSFSKKRVMKSSSIFRPDNHILFSLIVLFSCIRYNYLLCN